MATSVLNREAIGLIPWIVISWLVALGAGLLLWFARDWRPGRRAVSFLRNPRLLVSPGEILTFLFALGLPYAAIVFGFLDAGLVGLTGFSWWRTLGRGGFLGVGLVLVAGLTWWAYLRTKVFPVGLLARQRRLVSSPAGRPLLLLGVAAEEMHWAFYRSLPILVWGREAGLWIGLFFIAAERYGIPGFAARLLQPGGLEEEAWWMTKALAMTVAFGVLGNLWACMVLHALLEGGVVWLVHRHMRGVEREHADVGQVRSGAPVPTILLAAGSAVLSLALFTWGAVGSPVTFSAPEDAVQSPVVPTAQPTVPTPTPVPTRFQTPSPTPTPTIPRPTATPLPTATPTPTPPTIYIVQAGDTLKKIARKFDVTVLDLIEVNGITDPNSLQIGQELIIP
jgi:LysM repeat protein